MNIFNERYFNVTRKLLICIGLWEHEIKKNKFMKFFVMLAVTVLSTPHLISAITHRDDTDRVMMSLLIFLILTAMIAKMIGLIIARDELTEMLTSIEENWLLFRNENDKAVLHEYSIRGKQASIFYIVSISVAAWIITLVPLGSKILDIINPLNQSRSNMFLLQGEFFIERDEHFFIIFFWDAASVNLTLLITLAVDTMYIAGSQHCCALYAIVRYKLSRIKQTVYDYSLKADDKDSFDCLVDIVKLHQKALTFTSKLNDSYSTSLFLLMGINILLIPLNACAILANLGNLLEVLPFGFLAMALVVHLSILFWPGQRVIDHGLELCDAAYNADWYAISPRSKKLLAIFMLRCSQPVSLTAGEILVINFEVYSTIMKTAVSYISVFASLR